MIKKVLDPGVNKLPNGSGVADTSASAVSDTKVPGRSGTVGTGTPDSAIATDRYVEGGPTSGVMRGRPDPLVPKDPPPLSQQLGVVAKEEGASADRWKLRFNASHAFTTYWNSNIQFSSSRYNISVSDYEWTERGSRNFFKPSTWAVPGNNPAQILDEPSNTFTLSLEKNNNEFFFSAFHPKYFQGANQAKQIVGTIDGTAVDHIADVNRPFDGYNQLAGESEIVTNQNTAGEMQWELGYGRRITLFDHAKLGSLVYRPAVSAGIMTGATISGVVAEGEWWEFEGNKDSYGYQGFGGSISNRIEWNTPSGRFGVFYENKISMYHLETGFLDGSQNYNLGYVSHSIGFTFMLYNPAKHRKR